MSLDPHMPDTRERAHEAAPPAPDRAGSGWPSAVIAGAYQTGVLAVRCLTRRGVRAVCFDASADNPGFRSVYGPARLCPDPDIDASGWLRFMLDLASEMGDRPVLIPSSDRFVSAIARHAGALSAHYRLSGGTGMQGLLADKHTQYALADTHGMPMPKTQFARSAADVAVFSQDARFPCLLKPTHFREWLRCPADHPLHARKIAIAESPSHLLEIYGHAASLNPDVILQEIIEGPDSGKRVYLSCYDSGGRRIGNAMFRELRCDPLGFGPATVTEPIDDPGVDEVCDRFLQRLGYIGICEIEMKQDTRDGQFKLIEANPRLSGGGDAAPYAGVDICWLHYLDVSGRPIAPIAPSPRPFRHVVVRSDAFAVIAYYRAGLIGLREILYSYRPPLAFFDLDAADWRYSAETLLVAVRALVAGFARLLFRRHES